MSDSPHPQGLLPFSGELWMEVRNFPEGTQGPPLPRSWLCPVLPCSCLSSGGKRKLALRVSCDGRITFNR